MLGMLVVPMTVRLTLISLLQNVQSGMELNIYTFLCFL